MKESELIEELYMKKANIKTGWTMIIIGIIFIIISLVFVGGAGIGAVIVPFVVGIIMVYKSKKPILKVYSDYIDAPLFKRFYTEISKIEKKKFIYTFFLVDGSKKTLNVSVFDKEPMERLIIFFDKLKREKENT